ncbi:MAG TPA: transglycosylase SLT domain-containing protein [Leptolyngbyaceae cyanobacterium M33_DOE_097]|uniref:Tetratricopeptide repeat protein n=1 Tax=Oscillatoriales cyanobacterium SpSt-418 TaxID=2282169 RepID=A0A7C3KGT3_9CYAN|nr:transglycosylase SLT domain-containing protein [Leptolyngbyaceae cyanobacterium M33_DOE_097]
MLKHAMTQTALVVGAGLCVLLIGAGVKTGFRMSQGQSPLPLVGEQQPPTSDSQSIALDRLSSEERLQRLEALAQGNASVERDRARYLLAAELLRQDRPKQALKWLENLETTYPLLGGHILRNRAVAYEQTGDRAKAKETWQALVNQYPDNPVTAEGLIKLGQTEQAIAQFPAHPQTVALAQKGLKKNPKNRGLKLLIARHGHYLSGYTDFLDALVKEHGSGLKPEDWEAIAFGYWEKQLYGKAGEAYARSSPSSRNAYRIARGFQLGNREGAKVAYQNMIQAFPESDETALALLRLSRLAEPTTAIGYLDQVIRRFPDRAGEALFDKANLLEQQGKGKEAQEARKSLLNRYGKSNSAAEYRWKVAQRSAAEKNYKSAYRWAEGIVADNGESEYAPMAAYWMGKWSEQMRQEQQARKAYEQVLRRYPESYYAWRSATRLGWQVGDFDTVRDLNPAVNRPLNRPDLPVGSDILKELFRLGQDRDAWELWQVEFKDPANPAVAEQFTDGVLRIGVGDYLDGMFMLSFLSQREKPEEQEQYQALKRQRAYWESLYPFPYLDPIESWSQERRLNPLLVTALIRQESRFMAGIRSSAGAVGLMQVMPDTADWVAKQIQFKNYRLNHPEDNIKLGTWYLDYTHREYNNNSMLAVASYNAGPGAVARWVRERAGVDVDEFVEKIPYQETRGYVKSVFANYWNYLRIYNPDISRQVAQISEKHPPLAMAK